MLHLSCTSQTESSLSWTAKSSVIIGNGKVLVGVDQSGALNIPWMADTAFNLATNDPTGGLAEFGVGGKMIIAPDG
jgi:hypothetical protein